MAKTALSNLPPNLQGKKSIQKLATEVDRLRKKNKLLKGEVAEATVPGFFEVQIPAQVAAWAGGWMDARSAFMETPFLDGRVKPSVAAGLALLVGGSIKQQPWCIYAATALFAPHSYAMGVEAAGGALPMVELEEGDDIAKLQIVAS